MASHFVHEYDRGSTKEGKEAAQTSAVANVARCSRLTQALEQDRSRLSVFAATDLLSESCEDFNRRFSFKSLNGEAQRPLVLSPQYSAGYLNIAEKHMRDASRCLS